MDLSTNPFFTYGIDKLCAICHVILKVTDRTRSIFSTLEELESPENVIQVLQSFSNFIYYNDAQMVCSSCSDKIIAVYKFIQMCNKAHENIQNYLLCQEELVSRNVEEMEDVDADLKIEDIDISPTKIVDGQKFVDEIEYQKTTKIDEIIISCTEIKTEEIILQESDGMEIEGTSKIDESIPSPTEIITEERVLQAETEDKDIRNEEIINEDKKRLEEVENDNTAESQKENVNVGASSISEVDTGAYYDIGTDSNIEHEEKRSKKNMAQEKITCDNCHKTFSRRYFPIHMKMHTGDSSYKCDISKKKIASRLNFISHQSTHSDDGPFICQQCGTAFKWLHNLKRHLTLVHVSEKRHKCEICSKSFAYRSFLKHHQTSHWNNRPFICHCGKAFKLSTVLKQHLTVHTKERAHKCEICNKTFANPSILKRHLTTHSNDRPFTCQHCDKAFKLIHVLKGHLKTHTKERTYKLEICGKAFRLRCFVLFAVMRRDRLSRRPFC